MNVNIRMKLKCSDDFSEYDVSVGLDNGKFLLSVCGGSSHPNYSQMHLGEAEARRLLTALEMVLGEEEK